jgi:uncharacterized protein YcgI (DUF1989 family)
MTREDIQIEAESAESFTVRAGERFRIHADEGPQVADAVFFLENDPQISYASDMSVIVNQIEGTGDLWAVETLYSRPPDMRPLLTITDDQMGRHFPWAGGMCCSLLYDLAVDDPDHPNCADTLLTELRASGYDLRTVPDVFNIGLNVDIEDDELVYRPPAFNAGASIEFEAHEALFVAVSAFPNDTSVVNEFEPKPLRISFPD